MRIIQSNSQTKRILDFLRKNVPHSYNAKTIHRCLKIPINSVKVCLHRLEKKRKIFRDSKGFYAAYTDISLLDQLENPPTTLHGIMLECKTIMQLQKHIDGIPSCKEYTEDAIKLLNALDFTGSTNYRYNRVVWFEGRRITITIHLKGKIDIHITSTNNPIIYPDFLRILSYLEGFLEKLAPLQNRKVVQLLQVGVAKDYRQLRLDGIKSVTLHSFTNVWSRIYYKDEKTGTRFEHHITAKMNLDDALKSLSILTNPINLRYESKPNDPEDPAYG